MNLNVTFSSAIHTNERHISSFHRAHKRVPHLKYYQLNSVLNQRWSFKAEFKVHFKFPNYSGIVYSFECQINTIICVVNSHVSLKFERNQ